MAKKQTTKTKGTPASPTPRVSVREPGILRIGLIGYGFMGRAHANAIHQAGHFFRTGRRPVLQAVCGRNGEKVREFAAAWQCPHVETDWRRLVARDDIDAVDICTPNDSHM
ncbi:MAG: Gfo/Idh/MocA family oxidoreductase, partial [Phycisphaerae bacterium]|nr:Gfo/Idh/MocA family oxidoreductase [Phycisphaerae bacterium]